MLRKVLWLSLMVGLLLIVAGLVFAVSCDYRQEVPTPTPTPTPTPKFIPTSNSTFFLDTDEDGMNDWFEEHISQTDPRVYNQRFVIDLGVSVSNTPSETVPYSSYREKRAKKFFVENEKIPSENIFVLAGNWENGATFPNFSKAVSEVAQRSDRNSLVFVMLLSHGGGTSMQFADGKGHEHSDSLEYAEVGRMLNQIECARMVVFVYSCAGWKALVPLANEITCPRAVVWGAGEFPGTMGSDARYHAIADVIYGDGNGFVSLEEAINFVINDFDLHSGAGDKEVSFRKGKIIVDESEIASTTYIGDYIPENYSRNRNILSELKESGKYKGWYYHEQMLRLR